MMVDLKLNEIHTIETFFKCRKLFDDYLQAPPLAAEITWNLIFTHGWRFAIAADRLYEAGNVMVDVYTCLQKVQKIYPPLKFSQTAKYEIRIEDSSTLIASTYEGCRLRGYSLQGLYLLPSEDYEKTRKFLRDVFPVLAVHENHVLVDLNVEAKPRSVVRVKTSSWSDKKGFYQKKSITYLKRKSKYHNWIEDEISNIGALQVFDGITNINEVDDGVYEVLTCNESWDWETGMLDSWEYKLVEFEE
jgi:hypothetical protein